MTNPAPQPGLSVSGSGVDHPAPTGERPARPGWPEVGVAAAVYVALRFLLAGPVLRAIPDDRAVVNGLVGYALSAAIGLCAFGAACALRIRVLRIFGLRRVRWTWLLAGAGLGVVAIFLSNILALLYTSVVGNSPNVQAGYQAAATGGALAMGATLLLGAVATPIGEELAFRGVLTNALGRYGAWVAVPVSALVFALAHGTGPILVVALVNGVIAALLFRRTGSIWPGVLLHLVNNTGATLVPLFLPAAT